MRPLFRKRTTINSVILIIVFTQFLLLSAFGIMAPIFALFVTESIRGATVAHVGWALTVYWATKSVLQLFVARAIDRNHGDIDDYYALLSGSFLVSISIGLYYFAGEIWHVYALQFLIGLGDALVFPPFYALMTRHIDRGREGFEWTLFSSFSAGGGFALGGAIGGVLAGIIGFRPVFLVMALLAFVGSLLQLFLRPYLLEKSRKQPIVQAFSKKI